MEVDVKTKEETSTDRDTSINKELIFSIQEES